MLTVGALVSDCGLELAAGADGSERPIRWVHISEIEDPTPWLSGGELLLTTGFRLNGAARQRRFVSLLDEHDVAGLGLGTGFEHKRMPKAVVDEAQKRGMPLFEVPYEMPFIAITERAFTALSTSTTRCWSGVRRFTSGSSAWSSRAGGWTPCSARWPRRSAAPPSSRTPPAASWRATR